MKKVILTAAVCGAGVPRSLTPHVPITPREIADDVIACAKAGASVAHIHVRDDEGNGTMSTEKFAETVGYVREAKCNVVINLTTSGGPASDEIRMAHLAQLKPEIASYDAGTFNWNYGYIFPNDPQFLEKLGNCMTENQIKPEIEIFDMGMMNNAKYYLKKGIIQAPAHFQFVLGVGGAMEATVKNLLFLYESMPEGSTWSALGIGPGHLPIMYAALALGADGIRVGLEDNIYYAKGQLCTNVDLVERAKRIIAETGREVATPDEAREMLNLKNCPNY